VTAQTADASEADLLQRIDDQKSSVVWGGVMDTAARTWDWIGSVLLFVMAILIILAFGFL
jgi:hypothetical protein